MGHRGLGPVRFAVGVSVLVVVGVSVGGCDALERAARSSVTATPTSTSTTTRPPTPTPTATSTTRGPASVPAAATAKTTVGAAKFTQFFLIQFNRSQTEANPALLRPFYLDSCAPCAAYTDGAQALQDSSRRYADQPFGLGNITGDKLTGNTATVRAQVDQRAARVVDASGATVATATQRNLTLVVTLEFDNGWKIRNIEIAR